MSDTNKDNDYRYHLWKFFNDEHGLILVETELNDIIAAVKIYQKEDKANDEQPTESGLRLNSVVPSALQKEKHSTIIKNGCPECGSDITDGTGTGWQLCQNNKCGAMI
jgi:hypothetical protein